MGVSRTAKPVITLYLKITLIERWKRTKIERLMPDIQGFLGLEKLLKMQLHRTDACHASRLRWLGGRKSQPRYRLWENFRWTRRFDLQPGHSARLLNQGIRFHHGKINSKMARPVITALIMRPTIRFSAIQMSSVVSKLTCSLFLIYWHLLHVSEIR